MCFVYLVNKQMHFEIILPFKLKDGRKSVIKTTKSVNEVGSLKSQALGVRK